MVFINRLANGVGEEKDFYIAKNSQILVKTPGFRLSDAEIPQSIKEHGVKMLFSANMFTLKRENNKIVLKDISEQTVEPPAVLAFFRPNKVTPEIIINGYRLSIDKELYASLSPKEKKEAAAYIRHFEKIKSQNPHKSARHELKHLENMLFFNSLHENGDCLSSPLYLDNCYLDELSASCNEEFGTEDISLSKAEAMIENTCRDWWENPYKQKTYLGKNGDFQSLAATYESKVHDSNNHQADSMFQKIVKKYFTFVIGGKETDLSHMVTPKLLNRYRTSRASIPSAVIKSR